MKTAKIESWNDELQDTETKEITMFSRIKLGCDEQPVLYVGSWAESQDIFEIEKMAAYINDLDFNVQVIA